MKYNLTINKKDIEVICEPSKRLIDLLRERHLTGTKEGCGEGECGACLVFVDGLLKNSCLIPVAQVSKKSITTIEGITDVPLFKEIGKAFAENGGTQCGFCTPGFIMATYDLLKTNINPSMDDIVDAFSGNTCRCTGYVKITKSVVEAIKGIRKGN